MQRHAEPVSNAVQAVEDHLRGQSMEALDDEDVRGGGEGRCLGRSWAPMNDRPSPAGRITDLALRDSDAKRRCFNGHLSSLI